MKELLKRIDELEQRVNELESQLAATREIHIHYHPTFIQQPSPSVVINPQPFPGRPYIGDPIPSPYTITSGGGGRFQ